LAQDAAHFGSAPHQQSKMNSDHIGDNTMADTTSKTGEAGKTGATKKKRLPKGQRAHVRRLKQEARKAASPTGQPVM